MTVQEIVNEWLSKPSLKRFAEIGKKYLEQIGDKNGRKEHLQ